MTTCVCPFTPGNGIAPINQTQNPIPVVALVPVPAFVAVVMGIGGMLLADVLAPAQRNHVLGINVLSVAGGQIGSVAWSGPVVNDINGSGGWNFVLNQPVYIGMNGTLTQTPPTSGWIDAVGFAISQNSIMLRSAADQGLEMQAPAVAVVPFSANVVLDFNAASVFDLTLTGNTVLSISNGVDGRTITVRVAQDVVGGRALSLDSDVVASAAYAPPAASGGSRAVYQIQYRATNSTYEIISSATFA